MPYNIKVTGLSSLRRRVAALRARAQDTQTGLKRMGLVVLKAARERIKAGGYGDWAPNSGGNPLLRRSGRLINSLTVGDPDNDYEANGSTMSVGTNLKYAGYVQRGTGIYGPSGQPLTSTLPGGFLRFAIGGVVFYRRSIKGSPQRPFLFVDGDTKDAAINAYRKYVLGGFAADGGVDAAFDKVTDGD